MDGRRQPQLSVVILAWNTRELAHQCVQSILDHCDMRLTEVIVLDNASSDGTAASLRERFPGIRVIASDRNLGTGRGFNLAMKEAQADLILRMEPDAYVQDAVVQRMADFMSAAPDVGMLGCELRFPDGRHQHTAHRQMSVRLSVLERFWLYKLFPAHRRSRVLLNGYWPAEEAVEADWLAGITMVRRETFERTGGMDERFYLGGEESEWARRIQRSGYRILYEPGLGVIHHVGSASWNQIWTDRGRLRRWHRVGLESYAVQHGRRSATAYRIVDAVGVLFRALVYGLLNRLRPSQYYSTQASHYRMLFGFCLHMGELSGDRWSRAPAGVDAPPPSSARA
jgi:GT2 family glycosyltransferase